MSADSRLAEVLAWLWTAEPPATVRDKARELVLDTLGCVIAASRHPRPVSFSKELARNDPAAVAVPGFADRHSQGGAAALFAAAACWDEACEGLARAHGRPGVPVIAACSALAQARASTLGDLLRAVITGYEVGGRLGEAVRMQPGMHVDATWPGFGVAAAAVRLCGGTPEQALAAVRIAASQMPRSLYVAVTEGAEARNTYLAHAAQLGLLAAQSALAGFTAPTGALDALGAAAPAGPGAWLLLEGYFKPFAAVRHVHYAAAAGLRVRPEVFEKLKQINRIELQTYAEAMIYCGNRAPRNAIQAQFSLSYGLAHALVHGSLDPDAYGEESLNDPLVRDLERKVLLLEDEALTSSGRRGAHVKVLVNSKKIEANTSRVEGDPGMPMSREALVEKFCRYAQRPEAAAARFLAEPESGSFADALARLLA